MSEIPHFIAGIMNTCWGYILVTGVIDLNILIFAIPLSLHLLNVILIFEIPDKEADIHGKKKNFIVTYGRKNAYLLIILIFWIATAYYVVLSLTGWYSEYINYWLLSFLSIIPAILATNMYLKRPLEKDIATKFAIKTALSLFSFSIIFLVYFIYLAI
jgi:1,4-dihydroxy-2-naphthoate octaprenyltransferase